MIGTLTPHARPVLRRAVCLAALAAALPACGGGQLDFPVALPLSVRPAVSPAPPLSNLGLALVLSSLRADPHGRELAPAARKGLARYLAAVAEIGPTGHRELFPADGDVLAYLVNAHMAWTVALTREPSLAALSPLELRAVPFTVGRRRTSLAALADEILARAPSEPRFVLFLNPGFADGPDLPRWPLEAHSLAWQLSVHASECGARPSFWRLDEEGRTLKLSAFSAHMPGLPATPAERALRLLDLVPPAPGVRSRIVETCGPSLSRCRHTLAPLTNSRW